MKKWLGIAYDKRNIPVVICDGLLTHGDDRKTFEVIALA
jgi:hypothetical protein